MTTYFEVTVPPDVYEEFITLIARLGVDVEAEYEVAD